MTHDALHDAGYAAQTPSHARISVTRAALFFFATALLASPASAQDRDPAIWRPAFQQCVADATEPDGLEACRGMVSERCSDETEGGWSNLGMTECIRVEGQLWDEVLNADWAGHRAWAKAADVSEAEFFGDQFSALDDSLVTAQRAWIAFRDAECRMNYAFWGSGSMRHPAFASCITDMTADRVIELRNLTAPR